MARNHEKHYGRLNRLFLLKEKEEFEKANPMRPKLDLLNTPEEIQKWIPSIKKDIDFYLKKSKVTCYSDQQIEDCNFKILQLEKEFKAYIRKIKKLTPGVLDVIPWTSRPYKRKQTDSIEALPKSEFAPIATPLLDEIKEDEECIKCLDSPCMNEPLIFNPANKFNLCSKQMYSSERLNEHLIILESAKEATCEDKISQNLCYNKNDKDLNCRTIYNDSSKNNYLYEKYNEGLSMGFKNNFLLNQKNNVLCNLPNEGSSFPYGPIGSKFSVSTIREDLQSEIKESCKKRLCVPSSRAHLENVDNLCRQESAILSKERSNSEIQNHFSLLDSNPSLQSGVSNEKTSETDKTFPIHLSKPVEGSNQLPKKLVDYNCSDSDTCSE